MIERLEAKPAVDPPTLSLFELVDHSDWLIPARRGRPCLFSWRTALALAFREVPIRPLVAQLWPVLERMADQVSKRLTCSVAEGAMSPRGFADWLTLWREQFSHWHDPVRTLVCQYVPSDEVERLAGQLTLLDGFTFADFVLHAAIEFEQRQHLAVLLNGQIPTHRVMPHAVYRTLYSDAPAMSWACTRVSSTSPRSAPCQRQHGQSHGPMWATFTPTISVKLPTVTTSRRKTCDLHSMRSTSRPPCQQATRNGSSRVEQRHLSKPNG